jgi:hypothetical protein
MSLKQRSFQLFALLSLFFIMATGAYAQQSYGSIRGEVKDPQGGGIRDAKVTLTNEATGVARTAITNGTGIYLFGGVDPGSYKVTVEFTGFKPVDITGNVVTLGAVSTVDATLSVGGSNETVEVTADSLVLNTATASGGQLYTAQQVEDLPLLGRNPFMLEAFDANVVTLGDPRYVRAEDQTGSSQVSLAGAPSNSNSYVVDGIPISTSSGGVTFIPTIESVESAKVQTNTYDAEIGRSGGGVFNTTLKVGSSQYHGVLYGETRQTSWSSNLYYDKIYTGTATPGNNTPTPNDETYIYEGGIGGPVFPNWSKKPHWLNDTFFWIDEAGYRQGQPLAGVTTSYYTPTAAERNGDFSAYAPANGSATSCTGTTGAASTTTPCIILYDPTTFPRVSFLTETGKNAVPAADINKIGLFTANQFPSPTASTLYGSGANFTNNGTSFKSRDDTYSGKLEHTFTPWYNASISYVHSAIQEPSGNALIVQYANSNKLLRYTDATAINNTFVINPSTLLTVAYGQNRYYSASFQYSTGFNAATGFGGTGFAPGFASLLQSHTFPTIALSGLTSGTAAGIGAANGGPTVYASHNVVAVATKTLGRQSIKAGYAFRVFDVYTNPTSGGNGSFTFNGQYSDSNGTSTAASGTPLAIADLVMGLPDAATVTLNTGSFTNKESYNALFAQDDVRLNDKLTFNIGLRYEYELGQSEAKNRYNVGFDENVLSTYTGAGGAPVTVKGGVDFAGVNGVPIHCCANSHTKFSPRIGVSYAPLKNTVVHAGFGMFYSPVGIAAATTGYSQTTTLAQANATGAVAAGPNAYLTNPFPGGVLQPTGSSLGPLTNIGSAFTGSSTYTFTTGLQSYRKHFPLVEQYSLDVQQLFPHDVLIKLGYYGAHARNFANYTNINQIPDAVLAQYAPGGVHYGTNLATKVANPYYATTIGGLPATGVVASATIPQGQLLLPFPQFQQVFELESTGYSNYNSLVVKAEKRMAKGLTVLATYTWSANWDNIFSTGSQIYSTFGPQDGNNPRAEYARSINSIPNRYTAAITYDLPFGRGKKFLGGSNRIVDALVGGWEINDEWIIQNGVPVSIVQTNQSVALGTNGIGGTYQRPNLAGSIYSACQAGRPQGHLGNYGTGLNKPTFINPAAFTPAPAYTYGNTPRSLPCRQPGYDNTNLSVYKDFSITERVKFQFRAEALNAFNTPEFGPPSTTYGVSQASPTATPAVSGSSLGNITTTIGFARIIQLGGRLSF